MQFRSDSGEGEEFNYHRMAIADPRYELLKEKTSLQHNNGLTGYTGNRLQVQESSLIE